MPPDTPAPAYAIVIDRFGGKMQNAFPYSPEGAESMKKLMSFLWVKTAIGRWLS